MPSSAVDMCAPGRHDCEQVCVRDDLFYTCDCYQGYTLNPDKKTCSSKSRLLFPIPPYPPQLSTRIEIALISRLMYLDLFGKLTHAFRCYKTVLCRSAFSTLSNIETYKALHMQEC